MSAPHKATPEQWEDVEQFLTTLPYPSTASCLLELRDRIAALEAGATCPHIISSDEGTSYCRLAEQGNRQAIVDSSPAPAGGLVERVNKALGAASGLPSGNWTHCADAAILAVAEWLDNGAPMACPLTARWLREEVQRND